MPDIPTTSPTSFSSGLNMEAVNESNEKNAGPNNLCTTCRIDPAYTANERVDDLPN
jgi:hypothetical protein